MKILHITTVHKRYDTRIFSKECSSLSKLNYEVVLYVSDGMGEETAHDVKVVDGGNHPGGRLWNMIIKPIKALNYSLRNRFDIYHFHDPELLPLGIILTFLGRNVVYDIHDEIDVQINHKGWIPKILRPFISSIFKTIEVLGLKIFQGIVVVNERMLDKYSQYTNSNKFKVVRNYPIIDKEKYMDEKYNTDTNGFIFVGTISRQRGIDKVLLAAGKSNQEHKFTIVGHIPDSKYQKELMPIFESEKVNYLGYVAHGEAMKLIRSSVAGLMVYQPHQNYLNTYPVKLFEYLMCGIPVVASNFDYWEEFFRKYKCGILVDPNDHQQISEALDWLSNHKSEAKRLGENGRNAVLEYFSWNSQFHNLIKLYNQILTK